MYSSFRFFCVIFLLFSLWQSRVFAQKLPQTFPPPSEPPEFPAYRISVAIELDGKLDEPDWENAEVIRNFVQQNPNQGQPASFDTEVRVLYDDKYLYIGAICHDDFRDSKNLRVQNLRRDYEWELNDGFGIAIDGFLDKRFAVSFQTTPLGNIRDLQVIDAEHYNRDWDVLWSARTTVLEDRWIAEIAIPWKSLRYPEGSESLGVVFMRNIRRFNEYTVKPAIPRVFDPYRMAYEAILTDIKPPKPSANIQVNPYVLLESNREQNGETTTAQSVNTKLGGEIKWAVNPNSVLDLTVNTDFAQADVDRQVINLERFSVLFPERRQFFLENAEIFRASVNSFVMPFFSRRIGLDDAGNPIPLNGGLRFTNQNSKQALGILAMSQRQTDSSPESQFGVFRYSRYLGRQSRLGSMVTFRNDQGINANRNFTYTLDGVFRPNQKFNVQGMVSASMDDRLGNGIASQVWTSYRTNLLYAGWLGYYVFNYHPGMGLERFGRNYFYNSPAIDFDVRPQWLPKSIRRIRPAVYAGIFHDHLLQDIISADMTLIPLSIEWHNGTSVAYRFVPSWQNLTFDEQFVGITVGKGRYNYLRQEIAYNSDLSKKFSWTSQFSSGGFFNGTLTTLSSTLRWAPIPNLEISTDYIINNISDLGLERDAIRTHLFGLNTRIAVNPRIQFNGFYQYNSSIDRSVYNLRASWEYRPLSFLFLVLNSNNTWLLNPSERLLQQQGIAKLTYIRQF